MRAKPKGTPGPWFVNRRDEGVVNVIEILAGNGSLIIATVTAEDKTTNAERADARLIAAAPELLDALNGLYGLLVLFASREDVPPEVKSFASNHRAIDALAALEKAGS